MRKDLGVNGERDDVPRATTCRAPYKPALPEHCGTISRWIVRCEAAVMAVAAAAILLAISRPSLEDESPVKISNVPMTAPILPEQGSPGAPRADDDADPAKGHALYMQSCTACHGPSAQGSPHMGVNLRQSKFVSATSDLKLLAFLKTGRPPNHPSNTTGLPMPARGGNIGLDDDALADIVSFLRRVQNESDTKGG